MKPTFSSLAVLALLVLPAAAQQGNKPVRATPIAPAPAQTATTPSESADPVELFKFANMLYDLRKFDAALIKYGEFIKASPAGSPDLERAWLNLAFCYRQLQKNAEAKECFGTVLKTWPESEYAGTAAHHLAILNYDEKKYAEAIPFLKIAVQKSKKADVRAECQYFIGYVYQLLKRNPEAIKEYQTVLAMKEKEADQFRDQSELALAELFFEEGKKPESLKHYLNLAATAKDPVMRDNARFTAGRRSIEAGDAAKGLELLQDTLKSSTNVEYKARAQQFLIMEAWEQKNYNEVLRLAALSPLAEKDEQLRAQLELIIAHSTMELKDYRQALSFYGNVERTYPKLKESTIAGYYRLQVFYMLEDKTLAVHVDRFVATQSAIDANTPFIDKALLLKAETLYSNKDYANAAIAYSQIKPANLEPKYAPIRLFKMGWALIESEKNVEGIDVLGQYISQFPKHEQVSAALDKRAGAFTAINHFDAALADYQRLAREFPAFKEREGVLQRIAIIFTRKGDIRQMVEAYRELLAQFPNTRAVADANFFIGGGLLQQSNYKECLAPLETARKIDPGYKLKASIRLIIAYYHLEDIPNLKKEIDAYPIAVRDPDEPVPMPVIAMLGRRLYDSPKPADAEPYLLRYSLSAPPNQIDPDVFRKLADLRIKAGKFKDAAGDLKNLLVHQLHPSDVARAQMDLAMCYLRLKDFIAAEKAATEVLQNARQNPRVNAEARLLLGDIAMDQKDYATAARHYVVPCEFGTDEDLVPKAMDRMVKALAAQGQTEQAESYRQMLKTRFPKFSGAS